MPYIKQRDRFEAIRAPAGPGELNFAITHLIDDYLIQNALCYANINEVLGALEGAKLEFYRRVVVPYENKKMLENGDVYSEENLSDRQSEKQASPHPRELFEGSGL